MNWACNLLPGVAVVRKNSIGGISLAWRTRVLFGAACDRFSIGFRGIEELSRFTSRDASKGLPDPSFTGSLLGVLSFGLLPDFAFLGHRGNGGLVDDSRGR
jgi:hypothetical protein